MPRSMTGFGGAKRIVEPFQFNWEIRSVNNRFLDISFRMPEELKPIEAALREDASTQLSRGKVDCTLKLVAAEPGSAVRELDEQILAQLKIWQARIESLWPGIPPLSVADLLRWPGVLKELTVDVDAVADAVREAFAAALAELVAARAREGERIAAVLAQRLAAIGVLLEDIAPRLAGTAERHRDRLLERLDRLNIEAQPERLEQEIALIAQRVDVTEETDRLAAHIAELGDILTRDEPVGRRLDFLIQELNREANTLGSKVQDEDLTRAAVDLKVLIEQLREQVQNLE